MMRDLSKKFCRDGFVSKLKVLDSEDCAKIVKDIGVLRSIRDPDIDAALLNGAHRNFHFLMKTVVSEALLDHIESIIGPDILLLNSGLLVKDAWSRTFASWHQDSAYSVFDESRVLTAWLALTPSNPMNGCVRVIPRSHKQGRRHHTDTFAEDNMLSRGQSIDLEAGEESRAIAIELEPGEMSVHSINLVHGSNANETASPRIGLGMIFLPTDAKPSTPGMLAMLVRGEDRHNYFVTDDPSHL